ncbi:Phosphate regulon transcriptional regulatory protein phoB [Actinoplanes sp. SE50]|uniref:response regulator n=1 Tax=unclassified Actinoplanes TaxID=2626549 RepID=UPI00023ECE78|nr:MULTISPECIES: response regulator [unclassified Actinoplanes]AEV84320.1 Phosphate regulon transcriptional regulatory protein phoB [Actinoplanes sp. SE50/110]ATO82712.1 Phosphate regulon transcriptional regulatory protein phoB [Actinoplanes sp. SE50]SLM00119.1 response regulator receiver domain protein [Actinoplanes sp. SE50/110]
MATILIADDEPDIRDVLTLVLNRAGHRVLAVGDGLTALRVAERELPDLILADMSMPGLNGAELCHAIRRHRLLSTVPMAILSSTLHFDDPRLAGIDACSVLFEPMTNKDLVKAVEHLLADGPHRHSSEAGSLEERPPQYRVPRLGRSDPSHVRQT